VSFDLVALRVLHVGHLLGKTAGSEKLNARLVIIGPDDQGDGLKTVGDGFDVPGHFFSYVPVVPVNRHLQAYDIVILSATSEKF
jgi:hypothetical protein